MSRANFLILALPRSSNRPERKIGRRPIRNNGIWKRKGVRVLPSATTFSSPALEPWNAPWFHSFLLSSDEIVESLETRIALDHRGAKRPRFVGSLSTCRHCVTLYRVNLEGFSLRSNRGLFLVCLFVCSLTYFLWFLFPLSLKFSSNFGRNGKKGKNERKRERERVLLRARLGDLKNLESNLCWMSAVASSQRFLLFIIWKRKGGEIWNIHQWQRIVFLTANLFSVQDSAREEKEKN